MRKRTPVLLSCLVIAASGLAFLSIPKAHYICAGNDSVSLDFRLFRSGNFSIIGRRYDLIEGIDHGSFTYAGSYTEGPNTYDLDFTGLSHAKIKDIFKRTTAGGSVRSSDIYRMNKKTHDGRNLVYIEGCLLERK